jgi:hypothetical protein
MAGGKWAPKIVKMFKNNQLFLCGHDMTIYIYANNLIDYNPEISCVKKYRLGQQNQSI